ncbi:TRAP transporter, 4TM/12TM fusion protein [Roseovarius pacificus]|uniref:TRAP transporter, 4TM/12TM fusion protein n=1 Tax=Roseovarius pacificus TaxID=337701 RepID=A0A1M7GZU5_9RHOB|nr:TRAP transporter fused permease subunit [Roseovarius pacificus]GGO60052.1 ATP-binding protein [Roseovarius pacificus]SHM21825.1 TRAP transporter, 4TM/12TM fusion protein [Roseovarius pacificus]
MSSLVATTPRIRATAAQALALIIGAFIVWTAIAGPFPALVQRASLLAMVISLGLLKFPLSPGGRLGPLCFLVDGLLWAGSMAACGMVVMSAESIMTTLPYADLSDIALMAILTLTILDLSRRTVGLAFPLLVVLGLLYVAFGDRIDGSLGHRGFDLYFVTETLLLSDIGVWGQLTGIAATVIAAFVLFGAMLLRTGAGATFMDLAVIVAGRRVGGAAKIATLSSASFGTVNGSAVANVATTGSMTIPLMKKIGYPAPLAAAVEAVASTGGQITPPILGAAAFIMAEMVGVDYLRIALAALLPAAMFYGAALLTIHLIALRRNLGFVPEEDIQQARQSLSFGRLFPIIGGIGGLMWMLTDGRSVGFAASFGVICMLIPFVIADLWAHRDIARTGRSLFQGLQDAGTGLVVVFIMLAGAQILVSLLNLTGVGITVSAMTVETGGENLFLVALIAAVVCLILGMGVPTTAAYVLVASVMAPALIAISIPPLAAHMFVFYFATISVITPPLCVAVFVAASIADTSWWKVAVNAVRLGAVTYIVPFMFLTHPGILWSGSALDIGEAILSGLILVVCVSVLLSGCKMLGSWVISVLIFGIAAVCVVFPSSVLLGIGTGLCLIGLVIGRPFRKVHGIGSGMDAP